MPQPLRPTDSFNSSTATIVPDKKKSEAPSTRFWNQGSSSNPRGLASTSSLEGHINSALRVNAGGDDGMIGILHTQTQDMGGGNLSGLSFMREYLNLPDSQSSEPSASQSSSTGQYMNNDAQIMQQVHDNRPAINNDTFEPITSPHSNFEPIQSPHSTFEPIPSPNTVNNPFSTLTSPVNPMPEYSFRPSSSSSYHSAAASSVDASDYYSTTDMDTDDDDLASVNDGPPLAVRSNIDDLGIANMDLTGRPAIMTWTQYQPSSTSVSPNNIQPKSQATSPEQKVVITGSTAPTQAKAGSSKGGRRASGKNTAAMTDEDRIKADKLEHRRDINRRSAQKHRLQRKRDMEEMAKKLAEKDSVIHQLQRDLEVEKARNDQLRNLMNTQLARGSNKPI
ncbi:uncharacterized protein I206_100702 [Kwoniella pini CBS 10737]|uniref:BZIP domain-containing protein n=1 Tax=Kwoniella pini CBS 10737 TaxID=1296096 RepID=A0A1B9ICW0_9TREE|nr:uncharacterized protein I206_00625 [Kwoniella pini CBS 10737]OCF53323.1 hypothetical protein I206_00625 [Kwoniella pini CBS 10737]